MYLNLRRIMHTHGNIAKEGRVLYRVFYSAQYLRQYCALQAFRQFGALYMHNHDDDYSAGLEFEPSTHRVQDPGDTNEQLGPAFNCT